MKRRPARGTHRPSSTCRRRSITGQPAPVNGTPLIQAVCQTTHGPYARLDHRRHLEHRRVCRDDPFAVRGSPEFGQLAGLGHRPAGQWLPRPGPERRRNVGPAAERDPWVSLPDPYQSPDRITEARNITAGNIARDLHVYTHTVYLPNSGGRPGLVRGFASNWIFPEPLRLPHWPPPVAGTLAVVNACFRQTARSTSSRTPSMPWGPGSASGLARVAEVVSSGLSTSDPSQRSW